MRKTISILAVLYLLLWQPTPALAIGNAVILGASGAPSGPCSVIMLYVNTTGGNLYTCPAGSWVLAGNSGSGTGTVTTVSTGNLSPLFTASVATPTTTPALSFTLSTAAANTVFGNNTGSTAAPAYTASPSVTSITAATHNTATNCSSSAAPAVCGSAAAGSVVIAAAATTVTVNTTAVTANSQILIQPDDSLGTRLSVTCNTTGTLLDTEPWVSARTAGTSFTITVNSAPSTNPECLSYFIVN